MGTRSPDSGAGDGPTIDELEDPPLLAGSEDPTRLEQAAAIDDATRVDARTGDLGEEIAPDPSEGEVVGGRYRLVRHLGKGGAGSVFLAESLKDGSQVALKVLASSKVRRARVVQRFFDEVRAGAAVAHPGLIKVHDVIEEERPRRLAYAMEYVEGESLRARLKRDGATELRTAIQVGQQIAAALQALHAAGIVHRDLKPENIMLVGERGSPSPRVKLLDFGVVKFLPLDKTGGSKEAEKPGTFVGTPRYMAPEQAAGGNVGPAADLFSVGVMLFEMITGRCPHEGDSLRDVVLAKLKGAPRITVNADQEILPQELSEVVDACLQLRPQLRPSSAEKVAAVLQEVDLVLFAVGKVKAREPVQDRTAEPRPASVSREVVRRSTRPTAAPEPNDVPPSPEVAAAPKRRALFGWAIGLLVVVLVALLWVLARTLWPSEAVLLLPERNALPTSTVGPGAR